MIQKIEKIVHSRNDCMLLGWEAHKYKFQSSQIEHNWKLDTQRNICLSATCKLQLETVVILGGGHNGKCLLIFHDSSQANHGVDCIFRGIYFIFLWKWRNILNKFELG